MKLMYNLKIHYNQQSFFQMKLVSQIYNLIKQIMQKKEFKLITPLHNTFNTTQTIHTHQNIFASHNQEITFPQLKLKPKHHIIGQKYIINQKKKKDHPNHINKGRSLIYNYQLLSKSKVLKLFDQKHYTPQKNQSIHKSQPLSIQTKIINKFQNINKNWIYQKQRLNKILKRGPNYQSVMQRSEAYRQKIQERENNYEHNIKPNEAISFWTGSLRGGQIKISKSLPRIKIRKCNIVEQQVSVCQNQIQGMFVRGSSKLNKQKKSIVQSEKELFIVKDF